MRRVEALYRDGRVLDYLEPCELRPIPADVTPASGRHPETPTITKWTSLQCYTMWHVHRHLRRVQEGPEKCQLCPIYTEETPFHYSIEPAGINTLGSTE